MMQTFWEVVSVLLAIPLVAGVLLLIGGALYLHDKEKLEVQHAEG